MSPQELAAIVARDAEWRPDRDGRPNWVRHTLMTNTDRGQEFTAAVSDRRALLALLRETREALDSYADEVLWERGERPNPVSDPLIALLTALDPP